MKRSQETASSPQHKKPKVGPDDEQDKEWTRVERRKAKKARKLEAKHDALLPRFMYVNSEIVKRKDAIHIDDVRDLVLHIIADAPPPNWVKVDNARAIQKVLALWIPGLLSEFLSLPPLPTSATKNPNLPVAIPLPKDTSPFPFIASTFSHACPTRAPGDQTRMHSVLGAFFQGPISGEEKKRRIEARIASERAFDKDPSLYLLSLQQMIENDYPIPSYMADVFQKPPGWIEVPQPLTESILLLPHERQRSRVYAIDCEMCLTEDGKELTRVCVIDYESDLVVYDTIVKPPKPVIDYLTKWSGITEAHLANATTTLADVQSHLLTLLAPQIESSSGPVLGPIPILLGHSLESDLRALQLCHPRCIDTALLYHHPRGRPLKPGLAWLTKKWCRREIQTGEGGRGHDPEEDARACVELLRLKVLHGAGFGEFKTDYESIFERMTRAGAGTGGVKSAVVDYGNPGVMHGAKATTAIGCANDDEVVEGLVQALPAHEFLFGRLSGMADVLGWLTPKTTGSGSGAADTPAAAPPPTDPTADALAAAQTTLNAHLERLYAALPARTAVVMFTGHSDPRRMAGLNARRGRFEGALRRGSGEGENQVQVQAQIQVQEEFTWSAGDARELEGEVEKARRGLLFLGVK